MKPLPPPGLSSTSTAWSKATRALPNVRQPDSAKTTSTASTTPATSTTPTPKTSTATTQPQPLPSMAQTAPASTSTTLPPWTSASGVMAIANRVAAEEKPQGAIAGGSGLSVRLGAMTQKPTTVTLSPSAAPPNAPAQTEKSRSLLARLAVLGGRPLSKAEIDGLKSAVHLTRGPSVTPILDSGLRPTKNVLANWSTWMKPAVYMFPAPPKAGSLEDHVVRRQGMTEIVEVDLQQLDPDKLYKRVLDGAILYLSDEPIAPSALRHAGSLAPDDGVVV